MSNQPSLPPSSTRPPPTSSGNGIYLLVILLLGGGVAGLIAWRHSQDQAVAQAVPAASVSAALAVAHATHEEVADIPPPPPAVPDATPDKGVTKVASTNSGGGGDVCAPRASCEGSAGSDLQAALAFRSKTSHKCYDEALAQDSTLKGKVSINVRVASNGQVCSASVGASELSNPSVAPCIAARFRQGARLPSPTGGCVDVNIPMNLVPPH